MRIAELSRTTKETDIFVRMDLDGSGIYGIDTGIGFFDHMLTAFSAHSGIDMVVKTKGDLNVDGHHSVEDTGIVMGKVFAQAVGDKYGIARYGTAFVPMDESLAFACIDISNRPFLVFDADFTDSRIGEYDTCLTEEFFRAFAVNAGVTLHLRCEYGKNDHHKTEALFKAAAHAVKAAVKIEGDAVLSTKGVI